MPARDWRVRPPAETPGAGFVRGCDCCRRNIPLAEHCAGDGLCRACRIAADAAAAQLAAARSDDLGMKLAAGAAGAGVVVLLGLTAWWLGLFGPVPW